MAIGFITDFLDTLGIGSFATTRTAFKLLRRWLVIGVVLFAAVLVLRSAIKGDREASGSHSLPAST
jgi:hypothetical protein